MTKWHELGDAGNEKQVNSRITKAMAALAKGRKTYTIPDGSGLMLAVVDKGEGKVSFTWRFQYRRPSTGRPNNLTFGTFFLPNNGVTLADAREKAQEARELIAAGVDPAEARDEAREVSALAAKVAAEDAQRKKDGKHVRGTFAAEVDDWHQNKTGEIGDETLKNQKRRLEKHLFPYIGTKRLGEIRNADIMPFIEALTKKKNFEMLCQVIWLAREVFDRAVRHGRCDFNPIHTPTPELLEKRRNNREHHAAYVEPEKLSVVVNRVLERKRAPKSTRLIMAGAYTMQRIGSICTMRKADLDLNSGTWTIPPVFMKMKRHLKESKKTPDHIVPLSRQMVRLIRQAISEQTEASEWVFPNERDSSRPADPDTAGAALRRLGYTDTHTMHGFRASGRTIGQFYAELDGIMLETQLAHKNPTGSAGIPTAVLAALGLRPEQLARPEFADGGMKEAYLRKGEALRKNHKVEERRETMQKWADYLDAACGLGGPLKLAA